MLREGSKEGQSINKQYGIICCQKRMRIASNEEIQNGW
jgi:hypothetical protein